MTSPFIDKPSATNDKYDDVHTKGSTYGQDLKNEAQVRELLSHRVESPFQQAFRRFGEFATGMVSGIADAIRGEGGASFKAINVAVNERLGPINTLISETGERHKELADKVETIITDQDGYVQKSETLLEKIEDAEKKSDDALDKAETLITDQKEFKAEIQPDINKALQDSDKALRKLIDLNNEKDRIQDEFDKSQVKVNRLVQEQLWNHQDTLEFLDIRSPKSYGYNTKVGMGTSWTKTTIPYERFWNASQREYYNPTGYYNNSVSPFVTVLTKEGDKVAWVVCKGKWEGSFNISINWTNGAVDNWSIDLTKSGPRVFQFDGGALSIHIRQITVTVMPTCLNREVTVNFADYDTVQNRGAFSGDFSLVRDRKGRRDLRFSAPVKCNEPINVQDSDGKWSKVPAGTVISGQVTAIYYTNVKSTFTEVWEYDKKWDRPRGNDWNSHNSNTSVEKFEVG